MCPTTSDTTDTSSTFPLLVPPCCNIRVFDSHATSSHTLSFIQFQTYVTKTTFPEQRDAIRNRKWNSTLKLIVSNKNVYNCAKKHHAN